MRFEDDGVEVVFHFGPLKSLKINRKYRYLEYGKWQVKFDEIKGYWKNYRFAGRKLVYYIVLLTSDKMAPITPEMDEYDVNEVYTYLKKIIPLEVKC